MSTLNERAEFKAAADAASGAVREELVLGLIGAMGTDLNAVETVVKQSLERDYGYACEIIKISDRIRTIPAYKSLNRRHAYEYYSRMIEGGNFICEQLDDKGALADMAIERIHQLRTTPKGKRRAFIVHSLKRPDEVRRLREVYGEMFYAIAIFADEKTREDRLTRKINADTGHPDDAEGRYNAQRLIRIDEREDREWGQKVSDTFAQADYFVRGDEATTLAARLDRFLTLVFGKPYESPTQGEVAMMHAYTAALRSVDLSRQIGAAIINRDGRILTTGCNEVPSPGGGQYWSNDPNDARDFKLTQDMNDLKKRDAIVELLRQIDGVIMPEQILGGVEQLYENLNELGAFDGTRIDALIEFGRMLHAEMSALNGALLGPENVSDADLYCTTFPCHMCTRLIIGAGIRNVFYIEPYPKSAALELYGKTEIVVNPVLMPEAYDERLHAACVYDRRTHFLPFEGVAPRRYIELFAKGKRKTKEGAAIPFEPMAARPRRTASFVAKHLAAEEHVAKSVGFRAADIRKRDSRVSAAPEP